MSARIFVIPNALNLRRTAISQLDVNSIRLARQPDAVTFDKKPVDFGVVFVNKGGGRDIWLTVNAATSIRLKIKGSTFFRASLKQAQPPGKELPRADFELDEPILINEYVPFEDIVTDTGDIRRRGKVFVVGNEVGPRLRLSDTKNALGRNTEYRFSASLTQPAPAFAPAPVPPSASTQKDSNIRASVQSAPLTQLSFRPAQPNVFPNSDGPYYLSLSFDAPNVNQTTHTATLVVSFDDVSVEIPLQARTGDVSVVVENPSSPVILGGSAALSLLITNSGNVPAKVSFAAQKCNLGINIPAQDFNVPANQASKVSLVFQTGLDLYSSVPVSLSITYRAALGGNPSDTRKLNVSVPVAAKTPEVKVVETVHALQGLNTDVGVLITSHGPDTSFFFEADGLPDGVTIQNAYFGVAGGQTTQIYLTLNVAPHATVTDPKGTGLPFTVRYSAYYDAFKGTATVNLKVDNAFKIQAQEKTKWCWAAVTASTFAYYGGKVSQCTLADRFTPKPAGVSCCDDAFPDICNHGHSTADALSWLGILAGQTGRALNLNEVIQQIDLNRPIALLIVWASGGAHAIVISGYVTTGTGNTLLIVEDPGNESSQEMIDINTLTTQYHGIGTWTNSALTLPPPPPVSVKTQNSIKIPNK